MAKYEKFWFCASLLINFGRASVVVFKLGCVANYASFSDLVLIQLKKKRVYRNLRRVNRKKNLKKNL